MFCACFDLLVVFQLDSAGARLHLIAHLLVVQVCVSRLRMPSADVEESSKLMPSLSSCAKCGRVARSARGKRRTFLHYQDLVLFPTSITVELVVRAVDSSLPLCRLFSTAFLAQQ